MKLSDIDDYPLRLCVELLHYNSMANEKTSDMKANEMKEHMRVFFTDEQIEKAVSILTGQETEDKMKWSARYFDERENKEINFSKLYANKFAHGTNGHNDKMIISKMAALLDNIEVIAFNGNLYDEEIAERIRDYIVGEV